MRKPIISLSMSKEFQERLKEKAKEAGLPISEYVRYILMKEWDRKDVDM